MGSLNTRRRHALADPPLCHVFAPIRQAITKCEADTDGGHGLAILVLHLRKLLEAQSAEQFPDVPF